ncbi:MAG: hypothetical protein K0Q47_111 [Sedimentibacter sp.]|jgi:hypothetical protein|nr:hypothetical protein [Sedimentibacter sp.]
MINVGDKVIINFKGKRRDKSYNGIVIALVLNDYLIYSNGFTCLYSKSSRHYKVEKLGEDNG